MRSAGNTSRHHPMPPTTASTTPTTLTARWVTSPANPSVTPSATTIGHTVGAGSSKRSSRSGFVMAYPRAARGGSWPVEHQNGEEQGQGEERGHRKPSRGGPRAPSRVRQARAEQSQPEYARRCEIRSPAEPDRRRKHAHAEERKRRRHDLAVGRRPVRVDDRKDANAGSRVVVAIEPSDRERVRQLPEEDDGKQHGGAQTELAARREPAGHRRQRAGDGAHQHAERAARFERRVGAEIEDGRGEGEPGHGHADTGGEIRHTRRREHAREEERLEGLEPAVRQRAPSRALHERVDITLDILVQRECPARRHEGSDEQMDHLGQIRRSIERREVSGERAGEDHDKHARLAERDEIASELRPVARDRCNDDFDCRLDHRPTTYTTVKTTTHTPSTKCQYQETSSTRSAWTALSAPEHAKMMQRLSMTSPSITCEAGSTTSGKNVVPSRFVPMVKPRPMMSRCHSCAVLARNAAPSTTVTNSHAPARRIQPAASARLPSATVTLLDSRQIVPRIGSSRR